MLVQSNILDADARNVGYTTNSIADFFHIEEYLLHFMKSRIAISFKILLTFKRKKSPSLPSLIMLENCQTTFDKTLINSPAQITKWWIMAEVNTSVQVLKKKKWFVIFFEFIHVQIRPQNLSIKDSASIHRDRGTPLFLTVVSPTSQIWEIS